MSYPYIFTSDRFGQGDYGSKPGEVFIKCDFTSMISTTDSAMF